MAYKKLVKVVKNEEESDDDVQKPTEEEAENEKLSRMRSQYKNKQHTLVLASRGINSRYRHFMNDLRNLMPHSKKDVKYDSKGTLYELNEVADMKNCTNILYFECKIKRQDLYMWVTKTPNGPSVKFQVSNVHTMEELKFSGNCLQGSRPLLYFDAAFDQSPHMKLIKEMFSQTFGTPYMHPKSKPFIDHMLCFYLSPDGKIWFRNYQISDEYLKKQDRTSRKKEEQVLIEIGPRFVLNPIKILSGSFCGAPIYENAAYIPPSMIRSMERDKKTKKYVSRLISNQQTLQRKITNKIEPNELDKVFKNDEEGDEEGDEESDGGEWEGDEGEGDDEEGDDGMDVDEDFGGGDDEEGDFGDDGDDGEDFDDEGDDFDDDDDDDD